MSIETLLQPYVELEIVGLGFTIAGALISARGALIEDKDAKKIARTAGPHNHDLEYSIQRQSRSAKYGFLLIGLGSLLQIGSTLLQAAGRP